MSCRTRAEKAICYRGGAVSSRFSAATFDQAGRSYSWTMPPRTSRRVRPPIDVTRRHRTPDRLGELKAAMWSRFVVVPDVLVEHRFEVLS